MFCTVNSQFAVGKFLIEKFAKMPFFGILSTLILCFFLAKSCYPLIHDCRSLPRIAGYLFTETAKFEIKPCRSERQNVTKEL